MMSDRNAAVTRLDWARGLVTAAMVLAAVWALNACSHRAVSGHGTPPGFEPVWDKLVVEVAAFEGKQPTGIAVNSEGTSGREGMGIGLGHDQPARRAHLPVEKAHGICLVVVRAEGVRADHLGKRSGPVSEGADLGPHLVEHHRDARLRCLPCRFRAGHAAADDMKVLSHGVDVGDRRGAGKPLWARLQI